MKVLKFGGSSLANSQKFLDVGNIISNEISSQPLNVVLSAPQGITNKLVDVVNLLDKKANPIEVIKQIKENIQGISNSLRDELTESGNEYSIDRLEKIFGRLDQLVEGAKLIGFCPRKTQDEILVTGEKISVLLLSQLLAARNLEVALIDPTQFLTVSNESGDALADIELSTKRFLDLERLNADVSLMPGFLGINEKGEAVTLGRNGSDYSAAVLAVCSQANSCEIWTDVDGVYSADPRLVQNAELLENMSFEEAIELSYFGAKILHPKTITPLSSANIPCLIKNTLHPENAGTIISQESTETKSVKAIASLEGVSLIDISGPGLRTKTGMTNRIFSTLARGSVQVILISQSSAAYRISICIPAEQVGYAIEQLEQEFELELQNGRVDPIKSSKGLSVISLVGDNLQQQKGIAAKFFGSLSQASVNIIAIAQDSSERSISAVIRNERTDDAVKVCHQNLFVRRSTIDAFVIGCGTVGTELIRQIGKQQQKLLERNIQLNVYGIASSKKLLLDAAGIDLTKDWQEQLTKSTQPLSLQCLNSFVENNYLVNPVIIDATSSEKIANDYVNYLEANYHVVTANKKANTESLAYYQKLRKVAQANQRKFLYETNVGAGLPVIDNLQSLLGAGDQLIEFEGILSGSLSYIFGLLHQGLTLSKATLMAKELGYTEPNPAEDLSGLDVARKLLIIARETGLQLELEDIQLESIIPNELASITDGDKFMEALPSLDTKIAHLVESAESDNKVLRYIGQIVNGKCVVKISSVGIEHPMHGILGGENALAMHTHFYQPTPFVIRGYGAGAAVTAAGLFADVLRTQVWNIE